MYPIRVTVSPTGSSEDTVKWRLELGMPLGWVSLRSGRSTSADWPSDLCELLHEVAGSDTLSSGGAFG